MSFWRLTAEPHRRSVKNSIFQNRAGLVVAHNQPVSYAKRSGGVRLTSLLSATNNSYRE
jgi:hypothetical protein